ncbi:DUF4244 domain-containing protein [Actinomarinicola tropica]|uniref:DUF4244 domain-containing protein n=1 Tax=Actinomarinicola tropica TaxID=2789776 RepID=A0A5Q2RPL1_9ACTN|nr:DUF4244 domain-containing protein [Actinomarinicola tropica]QGG96521.1 DUF4244 domain-containing protein [Actinomarinicola tropica]
MSASLSLLDDAVLRCVVAIRCRVAHAMARADDRGQSTAEYALVMLGAAAVAVMVAKWAKDTDKITQLLDGVVDSILDKLT